MKYPNVILALAVSMSFFGCTDASQSQKKSDCRKQLQNIAKMIHTYVKEHGDLPRNEAGHFEPRLIPSLVEDCTYCVPSSHWYCTLDHSNAGAYRFSPSLELDDLTESRTDGDQVILACHSPEARHNWAGEVTILLFADGSTLCPAIDPIRYRSWVQEFSAGKQEAKMYSYAKRMFQSE